MSKNSRQRDAIYAELSSRYDHPTAEQLYFDLKTEYPNLSLATVYRNLKMFEADGRALRFHVLNGDRYDANTNEHYHLVCTECSSVIDLTTHTDHSLTEIFPDFKGEIDSCILLCYGKCTKCVEQS